MKNLSIINSLGLIIVLVVGIIIRNGERGLIMA
jgi:hypothetical protein